LIDSTTHLINISNALDSVKKNPIIPISIIKETKRTLGSGLSLSHLLYFFMEPLIGQTRLKTSNQGVSQLDFITCHFKPL